MSARKISAVVMLVVGGFLLAGGLAYLNKVGLSHPEIGMNLARLLGALALPAGLIAMGLRSL